MKAGILSVVALVMAVFTGTAEARGTVALVPHDNITISGPPGKTLTLDDVEKAIRSAAATQGYPWSVTSASPGKLQLTTIVRGKHTVVVEVTFDTKAYSIKYVNSANLNYSPEGGGRIHPNYNTWVQDLKNAIDANLLKA